MHQWFPVSMRKLCLKAISLSWYILTHHGRKRRMDFFTRAAISWETSLSAKRLFAVTSSTLVMGMAYWSRTLTKMGVDHRCYYYPSDTSLASIILWLFFSHASRLWIQFSPCGPDYVLLNRGARSGAGAVGHGTG